MSQPRELTFGTAGMRAPIGPAPDQMNVTQVTRVTAGLAVWLAHKVGQERNEQPDPSVAANQGPVRVAVGYDARYGSPNFAFTAAEVFAGAGFEVTLLPAPAPTQLIPWLIRYRSLDAGVQITASHNPSAYNGYKVYLADGAQLDAAAEREIEATIREVGSPIDVPRVVVRPTTDQLRRYIDDITELIAPQHSDLLRVNNERAALKVAYTALHGVGGRAITQAFLAAGFAQTFPVLEQHYPDPLFPTIDFPNPEEPGVTDLLLRTAAEHDVDVLIALDPDADRCAVGVRTATGEHVMLRGDDLGPLLATRIVPAYYPDQPGAATHPPIVVTSEVSSRLLSVIAADRGWDYQESCTGFKNLIRAADSRPGELVFAYEEANGTSPAPHLVGDKDGIATALYACAWAAELKAQGLTLLDELTTLHKRYGIFSGVQVSARTNAPEGLLAALRTHPPATLDGVPVCATALENSDGIVLAGDGVRVLARTSGTENKLKLYLEVNEPWSVQGTGERLARLEQEIEGLVAAL